MAQREECDFWPADLSAEDRGNDVGDGVARRWIGARLTFIGALPVLVRPPPSSQCFLTQTSRQVIDRNRADYPAHQLRTRR